MEQSLESQDLGFDNPSVITVVMGHSYKNEALPGKLGENPRHAHFRFSLAPALSRASHIISVCHLPQFQITLAFNSGLNDCTVPEDQMLSS